ncbi:alpha-galactosidase [Egicoccus sp. AB-alg6-2]|uniref:alpha-galactosidase n=1 Tax=Egicoccus sp. AB-alg6-2 TaxID=3242692 RepID=UPI00359E8572
MGTREQDVAEPVVLDAGGVGLVVDVAGGVPRVLHWGAPVGDDASDRRFLSTLGEAQRWSDGLTGAQRHPAILPEQSTGWMGTPGLEGHREGTDFSTAFTRTDWHLEGDAEQGWALTVDAADEVAGLGLRSHLELCPAGVVRVRATVSNTASTGSYTLDAMRLALPVPAEAQELLDFTGRHLRERTPQRHTFSSGTHLREGRRGRTGSDATFVLAAGTDGFGFRDGEIWAVHTAWSGNHATFAELTLSGVRVLGGGELLLPGEVRLAPGEQYTTPWLYGAHGHGLDAVSASFHEHLRRRETHPAPTRPVVLNTWEAVYFDHDLDALLELAELGARVGVERFVLDDGWFLGRRDARAGLGDWVVDAAVWPDGLEPLVKGVRSLGLQFGLWFEPEMVSEDSDLARAHPEWIMGPGDRLPLRGRHQQVLNLTVPEAFEHVLESISRLVDAHEIDYIKWDHNRDLLEPGDRATRRPRVHEQTLAVYGLMDELKRRHPGLEIESCSSGGGRVDLAVLERTDRVWASDCIDAVERQRIQRWTSLLLPPELIGSHVGAPTAHTTRRTHDLAFRAATAVFGHFGIEWDLRDASPAELDELAGWVTFYKQVRELVCTGTTVRCDYPDEAYWAHGVVAIDRRSALFAFVAMDTSPVAQPGRIRLPGLDPDRRYRIEPVLLSESAMTNTASGPPSWWVDPPVVSGRLLGTIGLQGPMIDPERALLVRLHEDTSTDNGR